MGEEESQPFPSPGFLLWIPPDSRRDVLGIEVFLDLWGAAYGKCRLPGERCSKAGSFPRGGCLAFSGSSPGILCGKLCWVWFCVWETEVQQRGVGHLLLLPGILQEQEAGLWGSPLRQGHQCSCDLCSHTLYLALCHSSSALFSGP